MRYLTVAECIQHAVITQFLSGSMCLEEACRRLKIHRTTLWRKIRKIEKEGPSGLAHKLRGQKPHNAYEDWVKNLICEIFKTKYEPYGFSTSHFYQEAAGNFPKNVSYPTVLRWLKTKGLKTRSRKGWRHHSRRPRRPKIL